MKINHYLDRSWFNGLRYTLHIMKIIIILLVLSIGNSFSMTYSQNTLLSLDINKQSIKEVIGVIEKKSEYVFFFSDNVRQDLEKRVDIKVNSKTLDVILNNLFADTDLAYTINDRQVSIAKTKKAGSSIQVPQQQTRTITGTIVDNTKEPLIGVNIVVKGTTSGTVTDMNGKFSLSITEANPVLVISYIGYKAQEIKVGNQSSLNVTLEAETLGLEEIVVVGYGTVKKKDLTGSVSSVNSETISKSPVTSATQAIQGRLPGVFISNSTTKPGESASVVIRGKRSISGSSDPLYIVDGIPVVGGINEISPSDIETIDILKDASATAIYGARGSNGVILITTKKGKAGKTQVDYNGYVGFQTVLNQLEYMDGAAYAETVRESYRSTGKYLSDKPSWEEDQKIGSFANDPYTLESLKMAYDENGNYTYDFSYDDEVICGNTRPKIEGVVGTSLNWKGLSLSLNFRYQLGADVFNEALFNKVENISTEGLNKNQDKRALYERWQKAGDIVRFKNIANAASTPMSSRFVQEENVLTLESVYLGYEFYDGWIQKLGLSNLKLQVSMRDVFRASSIKSERGISYPFARSLEAGLSFNF